MTRDEVVAARTRAWSAEQRRTLAELVADLRPSPHHLGDALDWLEDIGARDGVHPASVLAAPALQAARATRGAPPDRWKRWKAALRRLRYPRLAAREQAFAAAVKALDLGRRVAIAPPADFEGGTVTITIQASTPAELAAALEGLERCRCDGDLAWLFALVDE